MQVVEKRIDLCCANMRFHWRSIFRQNEVGKIVLIQPSKYDIEIDDEIDEISFCPFCGIKLEGVIVDGE